MADSPVGAAGWIPEKFGTVGRSSDNRRWRPGQRSKFSEEELLTNIMLYIAPASFVTATWIYYGSRIEGSLMLPAGTRIQVPTGVAAFPDPGVLAAAALVSRRKPTTSCIGPTCRGAGISAALEEPELMLADLRSLYRDGARERALAAFGTMD